MRTKQRTANRQIALIRFIIPRGTLRAPYSFWAGAETIQKAIARGNFNPGLDLATNGLCLDDFVCTSHAGCTPDIPPRNSHKLGSNRSVVNGPAWLRSVAVLCRGVWLMHRLPASLPRGFLG